MANFPFFLQLILRKGACLAGIVCLVVLQSPAQSLNIDSLEKVVEAMPDSPEKVAGYLDLFSKTIFKENFNAQKYPKAAGLVARNLENDSLLGSALLAEGTSFLLLSRSDSAIQKFSEALVLAKKTDQKDLELKIRVNLGSLYQNIENDELAEKELVAAKKLVDENTPASTLRVINNNLGSLYIDQGDNEKAIESLLEAQKYIDSTDVRSLALNYNNLGIATLRSVSKRDGLEYLEKSYRLVQGTDFHWQLSSSLESLIEGYIANERYLDANFLLDSLDRYAHLSGDPSNVARAWLTRSQYEEAVGNPGKALEAYRNYAELWDSLATANQNAQLSKLRADMELASLDAEIALLETKNELESERNQQANTLAIALAIGLGLFFVALVILIFTLVGRSRTNRLLQEKNAMLEELNREKDGLIGIVAHDLKSPLNKTFALTELILASGPLNQEQEKAANMVLNTNETAMNLIRDLLEINSLEYEPTAMTPEKIDLGLLFEEVSEAFGPQASRKEIKISFQVDPKGLSVETHRLSLSRILENLISNALKFSELHTSVKVSGALAEGGLQIRVRDEGPGISEADQGKLFGKFQRLTARPTGGESSTGLGLAITKSLVDKLGGSIEVDSSMGKGSTFVVNLPVKTS